MAHPKHKNIPKNSKGSAVGVTKPKAKIIVANTARNLQNEMNDIPKKSLRALFGRGYCIFLRKVL